jgi:hypothetical protein
MLNFFTVSTKPKARPGAPEGMFHLTEEGDYGIRLFGAAQLVHARRIAIGWKRIH